MSDNNFPVFPIDDDYSYFYNDFEPVPVEYNTMMESPPSDFPSSSTTQDLSPFLAALLEPRPIGPNATFNNVPSPPPAPPAAPRAAETIKKPIRSRNHYNYFYAHHRRQIRGAKGGLTGGLPGLSKEIARRWHNATEEEKAVFQHMAQEDKERYEHELRVWKRKVETAEAAQASMGAAIPSYREVCQEISHNFQEEEVRAFVCGL